MEIGSDKWCRKQRQKRGEQWQLTSPWSASEEGGSNLSRLRSVGGQKECIVRERDRD